MSNAFKVQIPERRIDVIEGGRKPRRGCIAFDLARDVKFSTAALESYAFAHWEPAVYDAMAVAAAIEYADRLVKRPSRGWARRLALRIPVHDPHRWNVADVSVTLHDAVGFLTGDFWTIDFVRRIKMAPSPSQEHLALPVRAEAVLAYSNGMDSRAVAGIVGAALGDGLVRVRMGTKARGPSHRIGKAVPFTGVPYAVAMSGANTETSARSRGFKFTLISGIAAYLADAGRIIIPESGQGAIGPALVTVAHAYPDYRNHPLFTMRMERFLKALLGNPIRFEFPRLWSTKGETLSAYVALPKGNGWETTRSCWRNSQWSAVKGTLRQCGVCAACMLRRMSVHAAGLSETADTYVCTDLGAETLRAAIDPDFTRWSNAFAEYALAGVLHLDHLADMATDDALSAVRRHAALLGPACGLTPAEAEIHLVSLLGRHAAEWNNYLHDLGARSFVRKWTRSEQ